MQDFYIGQPVKVKETAEFYYDEHGKRHVRAIENVKPFEGFVTGKTVRYLGQFKRGNKTDFYNQDFTEAELKRDGSISLWLVKKSLKSREQLVLDDQLEALEEIVRLRKVNGRWELV